MRPAMNSVVTEHSSGTSDGLWRIKSVITRADKPEGPEDESGAKLRNADQRRFSQHGATSGVLSSTTSGARTPRFGGCSERSASAVSEVAAAVSHAVKVRRARFKNPELARRLAPEFSSAAHSWGCQQRRWASVRRPCAWRTAATTAIPPQKTKAQGSAVDDVAESGGRYLMRKRAARPPT